MALIRYPGSKEKLVSEISSRFPSEMRLDLWAKSSRWEYREPFFGSGAAGFPVLETLHAKSPVRLNDMDYWLTCLWNTVRDDPQGLIYRIDSFTPSVDSFYQFKEQDGDKNIDVGEAGFRKLALHQMSYSGFGFMSGGPLGGRNQANAKHPVHCRWSPSNLKRQVVKLSKILNRFPRFRFSCGDFSDVLKDCPRKCFVYLDPPYVGKGNDLYKHGMTESDHERLAKMVLSLQCHWVLSYDDHPLVRELYRDCLVESVFITYTNAKANGRRPKNQELVITPKTTI